MNLFRYSGAGDELISPVYIAPTLPPFVERTWPEEEVTMTAYISYICIYVMVNKNIYHHYFDSDFVTKNVSAHLTLVGPLHIFCNASKYSERTKQIALDGKF